MGHLHGISTFRYSAEISGFNAFYFLDMFSFVNATCLYVTVMFLNGAVLTARRKVDWNQKWGMFGGHGTHRIQMTLPGSTYIQICRLEHWCCWL